MNPVNVFFIGNPASGKTRLLRSLAEQSSAAPISAGIALLRQNGQAVRLEELPGIYSLGTATTTEQWVRQQLVGRKPDLVVNVVDATNLERDLYLTVQLLEMGLPLLVALSKQDKARAQGLSIAAETLSAYLQGVPVLTGDLALRHAIVAHLPHEIRRR